MYKHTNKGAIHTILIVVIFAPLFLKDKYGVNINCSQSINLFEPLDGRTSKSHFGGQMLNPLKDSKNPLEAGIIEIGNLVFISDSESLDALNFLFCNFVYYAIRERPFYCEFPQSRIENEKQFQKELPDIQRKCKVGGYVEEVFYHKHGLRSASKKILDYISKRDILDIGAFYGDSSCALDEYTNLYIYKIDSLHLETFSVRSGYS